MAYGFFFCRVTFVLKSLAIGHLSSCIGAMTSLSVVKKCVPWGTMVKAKASWKGPGQRVSLSSDLYKITLH